MTTKLEEEKIKAISDLGKSFSDATIFMHEAIAKKVHLSGTDHKYLGFIIQNGEMTAGELAKLTGLTTGAITGLIDRLEKKKLVKRKFDKTDRRKIMILPHHKNVQKLLGNVFSDLQNRVIDHIAHLSILESKIIEGYLLATIGIMKEVTDNLRMGNDVPTLNKNKS